MPPTEPELQRVRQARGISWKAAAGVATAVIVGIVGLRLFDTPQPQPVVALLPSRGPTAPVMSSPVLPSASASPIRLPTTEPGPRATRMPEIEPPQTAISDITLGQDAFALIAEIDGRQYIDVLHETEPGAFTGVFRLPFPSNAKGLYRFGFVQLWTREERARNYVEIGAWDVALGVLKEGTTDGGKVLVDSAAAKHRARALPRAVRRGYSIVVGAESRYTYGVITVAVEFGV